MAGQHALDQRLHRAAGPCDLADVGRVGQQRAQEQRRRRHDSHRAEGRHVAAARRENPVFTLRGLLAPVRWLLAAALLAIAVDTLVGLAFPSIARAVIDSTGHTEGSTLLWAAVGGVVLVGVEAHTGEDVTGGGGGEVRAGVEEVLGDLAANALGREQSLPARRAVAGASEPLGILIGCFGLGLPTAADDLGRALDAYSASVAHQAFADSATAPWGEIRPGASADLVILDDDPRTLTPAQLANLPVRATYLRGSLAASQDR